jgi:mitochondrial fission protein ELM1
MPDDISWRESDGDQPVVWLLQGPRLGDNEQVLALGASLQARFGWARQVKHLVYRGSAPSRVPLAEALDHVDLAASDPIMGAEAGPAPDLIISIGRRAAPVGRWLKSQRPAAGIHVQLGRYQDHFRDIDLLVTTAQYALPVAPNVLHLTLPITARPQMALDAAAAAFRDRFENLPRPLIGVLVGGPSRPIGFGLEDARRLCDQALAFASAAGGTLLFATSPRTPAEVEALLQQAVPAPHLVFPFARDRIGPNPYLALLSLCDRFVVTSDSVSMLADACLTGRETRLFDLPVAPPRSLWRPSHPQAWAGRRRVQRLNRGRSADFIDRWFDGQVRLGLAQPSRYVPILANQLLRQGLITHLGDQRAPDPGLAGLAARELAMVTTRIDALLSERRARIEAQRLARPADLRPADLSGAGHLAARDLPAGGLKPRSGTRLATVENG